MTCGSPIALLISFCRKHPWQISSQMAFLTKFAKEKGFRNLEYFVDDGYSGANFVEVR